MKTATLPKAVPPSKMIIFIPQELEAVRPDLQRFFDAMVYKLRRNAHKGNWEDLELGRAFELMHGEIKELATAIDEGNSAEIVFEAADVANFALMIANITLRAQE